MYSQWAVVIGQRIILSKEDLMVPGVNEKMMQSLHHCRCKDARTCLSCVKIADLLLSPQDLTFPVVIFITSGALYNGSLPELHWFFDVSQLTAFLAYRPSVVENHKVYQGLKKHQIPHRWASVVDLTDPKPAVMMLHQSMLDGKSVNRTSINFGAVFQNARLLHTRDRPTEHELELRQAAQEAFEETTKKRE